ncbi:MAG: branched-chain-amino-acid transaminase [Candidatus Sumerlaeia bacterium]
MGLTIYLDGKFVDEQDAKISVFDHGLLYGDGVFEGIRLYNGCVFRLRQHLERMFESAHYMMLTIPHSIGEMEEIVAETCRRNHLKNGYIRLVVTRGTGTLGLSPWLCPKPVVFCIASNIQLYPEEYYRDGLAVATVPTRRNIPEIVNPRVKSLNYLNNIFAKIEARNAGCMEAIMLNPDGYVAECTGDNIFIVKKGALFTPPTYMGALRGITMDAIIELAKKARIQVHETPLTLFEIYNADEMFLTGTAAEVIPVVKADARVIGTGKPGPITKKLIQSFRALAPKDGYHIYKNGPSSKSGRKVRK